MHWSMHLKIVDFHIFLAFNLRKWLIYVIIMVIIVTILFFLHSVNIEFYCYLYFHIFNMQFFVLIHNDRLFTWGKCKNTIFIGLTFFSLSVYFTICYLFPHSHLWFIYFQYFQYKRQSTEGLSLLMFLLAIFGNLTYGLAIIVRDLEGVYIIRHIPWLIGSLGVILLDASVSFHYNVC